MRAKTVNFERGQEPYDAMDIGMVGERKIAKIHQEITDAVEKLATSLGTEIEDQTGKDRITIGFTKNKEFYYISFDTEEVEANEYAVGWYKTENIGETGNGDELYFNSLEACIDKFREWFALSDFDWKK
jgi:hypothetical protein